MLYVPYHKLEGAPNIIVDGAANEQTVLALSHWPGSELSDSLKADLSAEIAFNYLEQQEHHVQVEAISNNHFDADGLVGLWTLLNPEDALDRRDLVIDVASAGDFGVYKDRDAARVSFMLDAWMRPDDSPLNLGVFQQPYLDQVLVLYEELLPRFIKILDRIDAFEKFWGPADQILDRSEEQIRDGLIHIKEYPTIDLAVISVPEREQKAKEKPHTEPWDTIVHPMAIHNQTQMHRILLVQEHRYALYYRYETWVQYISRPTTPRFDLTSLCAILNQQEQGATWSFDDINAIQPWLKLNGKDQSRIEPEPFIETVVSHLATQSSKISNSI